jgi:multiple sugar transport system substrate-binding protein
MKYRRILIGCAVIFLLILPTGIFAGDSGKADDTNVKLTYVYWGSIAEDEAIKTALKNFEAAHPGITVEPMYLPGDLDGSTYNAKMKSMAASGTLPDLGYFRPEEFANYAVKDFFLPLDEYIEADGLDIAYLPQTWKKVRGVTYGAYTAAECQVMWYNKDVLKAAGVPLPPASYEDAWKWDTFVNYLKQITVDNSGNHPGDPGFNSAKIQTYGVVYDLWSAMYYPTLWSNSGGVITDDGTEIIIDSPESIEAIQRLGDLINKHYVMPYMGGGSGLPSPSVMLANEQLGFWVTGQWTLLELGGIEDLPLGVAGLPVQKNPAQLYLSGINVIFAATKHPGEAWLLQKWMMDPGMTLDLYTSGLWMPTKESYYTEPSDLARWIDNPVHPEGFKEAVLDSMQIAIPEPIYIKNINQIWGDFLNGAMEKIWTGQATAEAALKEAAHNVRHSGLLEGTY